MTFYWDPEKKLEANLKGAAQACFDVLSKIAEELHFLNENLGDSADRNTSSVGSVKSENIRQSLSTLTTAVMRSSITIDESLRSESLKMLQDENLRLFREKAELIDDNKELEERVRILESKVP